MAAAAPESCARISDELLIERLCSGDQDAFEGLFERFFERVYLMVGRTLKDRTATERMVSRIFVQAFSEIESYQGESPLPVWFFGFARRALSEHQDKQARRQANEAVLRRRRRRPLLSRARFQPVHDWMSERIVSEGLEPQLNLCEASWRNASPTNAGCISSTIDSEARPRAFFENSWALSDSKALGPSVTFPR